MDFAEFLKPGITAERNDIVSVKNTAAALGSGGLEVYSTPAMIALIEGTCLSSVDPLLPPGWSTVGTELNIKHLAATPLGMKVRAKTELIGIEGRALQFRVEAFDEAGKIAEGTHSRFIVESAKFIAKTEAKN